MRQSPDGARALRLRTANRRARRSGHRTWVCDRRDPGGRSVGRAADHVWRGTCRRPHSRHRGGPRAHPGRRARLDPAARAPPRAARDAGGRRLVRPRRGGLDGWTVADAQPWRPRCPDATPVRPAHRPRGARGATAHAARACGGRRGVRDRGRAGHRPRALPRPAARPLLLAQLQRQRVPGRRGPRLRARAHGPLGVVCAGDRGGPARDRSAPRARCERAEPAGANAGGRPRHSRRRLRGGLHRRRAAHTARGSVTGRLRRDLSRAVAGVHRARNRRRLERPARAAHPGARRAAGTRPRRGASARHAA